MAFPIVIDADTQHGVLTSNSNSWTLTYPTNLESGDLILAFVATDGTPTGTWPSGWIQNRAATVTTLLVAKKLSDGTETGNFTLSLSASEQGSWRVFRIRNFHGTIGTTFNNVASTGDAACLMTTTGSPSQNPNPPSLDPINWAAEDTLWFAACAVDTSRTFSGYPANYGDTWSDVSGGSTGASLGGARRQLNASSDDPGTFTISTSDDWAAVTVAIRPGLMQMLSPSAIGTAESFGSPTVTPTITLSPTAIDTQEAFGSPEITVAAVGENPWVLTQTLGTSRTDNFYAGFRFNTNSNTPKVTRLGRWKTAGNSGVHALYLYKFVDGGSGDVREGQTSVDLSSGADDSYVYGALASPVTLLADTQYYVLSQEFGGDVWHGVETTFDSYTPGIGTLDRAVYKNYGDGPDGPLNTDTVNRSFVPPNIIVDLGGIATLSPSGIASGEAVGSATVTPGTATVSPSAIDSAEGCGTPTVTPPVTNLSPSAIGTEEAFGQAVVNHVIELSPSAIGSGEAFGSQWVFPQLSPRPTLLQRVLADTGWKHAEAVLMLPDHRLIVTTQDYPAHFIRFNTPALDLTNKDQFTFADDLNHGWVQSLTYDEAGRKLYASFYMQNALTNVLVSQIDPDTLDVVDVIHDGTWSKGAGAIIAVGDYLYAVVKTAPNRLAKYSLSDFSLVTSVELASLTNGHSLLTDGTHIFVMGEDRFAKVLISDLSVTTQTYDSDQLSPNNTGAVDSYVWTSFETGGGQWVKGSVNKYLIADITQRIRFDPQNFVPDPNCWDAGNLRLSMGFVWVTYVKRNDNPETGSRWIAQISPTSGIFNVFELPSGLGEPNGILTDSGYLYGVGYTNPLWVARLAFDPSFGLKRLSPGGIATGEAFGTPTITAQGVTLSPTGIETAEAFGGPTVTPGVVTVSPGAIASGETFGSATVTPGEVTVSPSAIGSAEAFGAPVVGLVLTLSPSAIGSAETFGDVTVTPGQVAISPGGISSVESFGTAQVQPGEVTVSPSAIGSAEVFGAAAVTFAVTLSPSAIASAETIGSATVTPGTATVSPSSIGSGEAFGQAAVQPGVATLSPSAISSGEAFGAATLSVGAIELSPSGIGTGEALGSPGISTSIQVSPAAIGSAETFGQATVAGGRWDLAPTGIPGGEAFGTAAVQLGAIFLSPSGIATGEALGTPAVQPAAITLSPGGIATGQAFGTPGLSASVRLSPAAIGSSETLGTPGLQTSITVSPAGIGSGEVLGSPLISTGSELIPAGIASGEAFGAAAIVPGETSVLPIGIASGAAFGTATLTAGAPTLAVVGIPSEEAFGTPFAGGSATIGVLGIGSAAAFGLPEILPGVATITGLRGVPGEEAFGLAVVIRGAGYATTTYTTRLTRQLELRSALVRSVEFSTNIFPSDELDSELGD